MVPLSGQADFSRTGEVLRDIARGGLSGVLAGIVTGRRGPSAFYAALTLMGTVLVLPFVLLVFLTSDE